MLAGDNQRHGRDTLKEMEMFGEKATYTTSERVDYLTGDSALGHILNSRPRLATDQVRLAAEKLIATVAMLDNLAGFDEPAFDHDLERSERCRRNLYGYLLEAADLLDREDGRREAADFAVMDGIEHDLYLMAEQREGWTGSRLQGVAQTLCGQLCATFDYIVENA